MKGWRSSLWAEVTELSRADQVIRGFYILFLSLRFAFAVDDNLNSQYQAVAEIRKVVEVEKIKERQGLSKESATVQWNEKSETSLSRVPNLVVQCKQCEKKV